MARALVLMINVTRLRSAVAIARAAADRADGVELRAERASLVLRTMHELPGIPGMSRKRRTLVQLTVRCACPLANAGFGTALDTVECSGEALQLALEKRPDGLISLHVEQIEDIRGLIVQSTGAQPRKSGVALARPCEEICPPRINLPLADATPTGFSMTDVIAGRVDGLTPQTHGLAALALLVCGVTSLEVASAHAGRVARIEGRDLTVEIVEKVW